MTDEQTTQVMALVAQLEELCDEGNYREGTSRQFARNEVKQAVKRLVEDGDRLRDEAAMYRAAVDVLEDAWTDSDTHRRCPPPEHGDGECCDVCRRVYLVLGEVTAHNTLADALAHTEPASKRRMVGPESPLVAEAHRGLHDDKGLGWCKFYGCEPASKEAP